MKKALRVILRITGIIVLVLLLAAIIIPVLFKDRIKEKVVSMANEQVDAELYIGDFGITLFRNFPNLTFRLKEMGVTGVGMFGGDTLASVKSFNLVFDISSVFSESGYRITAIDIDRPVVNAIIPEDGRANYDIVPLTEEDVTAGGETVTEEGTEEDESDLAFSLKRFKISNGGISYTDETSGMKAVISDLDMMLSGNMAAGKTDLLLETDIGSLDFITGGVRMLNRAEIHAVFDVIADLENNSYLLGENSILINAMKLVFSGSVELDGEDIVSNLSIATADTEFKSLLSMVPAVYMEGYEGLDATGSFKLESVIKGRYSAADSLLPDVNLTFTVSDGGIAYPDLPESIDNINIAAAVAVDGTEPDRTVVDIKQFHFELAGNPFDMHMQLSTPVSNPAVDASFTGSIDMEALAGAVPVEMNNLKGVIDMALGVKGSMSMVEERDFDSVEASGSIKMSGFELGMDDMPPIGIDQAEFNFSPQYAALDKLEIDIAGNAISLTGRLQNYLPFALKGETLSGTMNLYSAYIDLDTILSYMPVDTTVSAEDTVALSVIRLPENVDFEFLSLIDRFNYSPLEASNLKGNIILREGVLMIRETGLQTLGGEVALNAEYDPRDSLDVRLVSGLSITGIGINESFNTFNTIRQLAPVAAGMDGDVSVDFDFTSQVGEGMMPLTESISGSGRLRSDEIQLVSSPVYEKISSVLQFGDYSNTFKDVDVNFEVRDGRVYIKPFDTKLGDMKVNVSGDHGLDQTINYLMKVEVPSSKLPPGMSSVLTGLAASAAMLGVEYYQPEIIKMNVKIGGTVKDPEIRPSLGGEEGASGVKETVKEAAKEAVQEQVEEVKEQVTDRAAEEAEKILVEAQKRADMVKVEAAEAAVKIREEADRNAQKLIDEAADKGMLARMAAERAAEALRKEADKKATQLEEEAARQADKIMEEAREKAADIKG
ncbi:MAG: AsmA-like C-terminal region-containing protein [Bacteroidales bacterium]